MLSFINGKKTIAHAESGVSQREEVMMNGVHLKTPPTISTFPQKCIMHTCKICSEKREDNGERHFTILRERERVCVCVFEREIDRLILRDWERESVCVCLFVC